jgi:DNA-binding NarL/FixJ family response regulator
MSKLTPREYQVAMLVARGLSNKEIARQLELSGGTVKLHVHSILRKLGSTKRYAILACRHIPGPVIAGRSLRLEAGDVVNPGK